MSFDFLIHAVEQNASDIFIIPGLPLSYKIDGEIRSVTDDRLSPAQTEEMIRAIYELSSHRSMDHLNQHGDDDLSCSIVGKARFRASILKQRGSLAAVIRVVRFEIPSAQEMHIPPEVMRIADLKKGLVLVTGSAGSGKSTTLACIIDQINRTRNGHIITLEDPIEYLHRHNRSIVTQREIGLDTDSYVNGLIAALRQAPDVILLGEMRDFDTIKTAITAAETGHLVISTLHTTGAANSIDRIIDVFPSDGQQQVRVQLAMVLQAVVSQQLLPSADNHIIPAFETMFVNDAIRTMIREGKIHQIDNVIATSAAEGMNSMDSSLLSLLREQKITQDTCISYSSNPEQMRWRLLG